MTNHTFERGKIYSKRIECFKYLIQNRIKKNHLDAFEDFLKAPNTLSRDSLIIRCKIISQQYNMKIIIDKPISRYRYDNSFLPFLKKVLSQIKGDIEFFVLLSDRLYISSNNIFECSEFLKRVPLLCCDKSTKDILSQYYILIPDFYIQERQYKNELKAIDNAFKKNPFYGRSNIIKWRGSLTGPDHPTPQSYVKFPRYRLLEMSFEYPEILDARLVGYENFLGNEFAEELKVQLEKKFGKPANTLPPEAFVSYKYLMSIDGVAAAWKRVPTILASGSVLLLQYEWEQFFYPGLKPFVHYVPIKQDLSDLLEKYEWLRANIKESAKIAHNGRCFAKRFLIPSFLQNYFIEILNMCCELYDA